MVWQNLNPVPSSAMDALFMQGGYSNSTVPHFNLIANPSTMAAPYIQGGYTSLLIGVDQSAVRKLHFDGVQEE